MNFYQRKLYALLRSPEYEYWGDAVLSQLQCLDNHHEDLRNWWNGNNGNAEIGRHAQDIASSSDRVNLYRLESHENPPQVMVRHPISGQKQQVTAVQCPTNIPDISIIKKETCAKKVFWWFWRFYPELLANEQQDKLLFPAHTIIPDCPLHSHQSTVSALTGAMFPKEWKEGDSKKPYLLIFSFSPVQEFIKSSRKFLDFWAGSYLLHYLSSRLCWYIAQELGPDAVILPSLWSQEIIDALIVKEYSDFAPYFICLQEDGTPVNRFTDKKSTSLSTAGFPNIITVVVPGKEGAQKLGKELKDKLTEEWVKIGEQVRLCIREKVVEYLKKPTTNINQILKEAFGDLTELSNEVLQPYRHELRLLQQESCWEWNKLWDEQLNHTWEPYWTAVPLGSPDFPLINNKKNHIFEQEWIKVQQEISQSLIDLPSEAEANIYKTLNVGTWWGSLQQRLRICLVAVKNTRNWQIPTAPGERSSISGQFSAVHPRFNYTKFAEGAGTPAGSMRLFGIVISKAFPGLFNGSEKLNALELTKRMAWVYGGVAEDLGIDVKDIKAIIKKNKSHQPEEKQRFQIIRENQVIYERLLRFPNLSSIASARFIYEHPELTHKYWEKLTQEIKLKLPKYHRFFRFLTRFRSSQVPKTDGKINPLNNLRHNYNGVMFSSKWLADDMGLQGEDINILRNIINTVHRHPDIGFGESSPADWWVIILADGDGMGSYVSGEKLKKYKYYLHRKALSQDKNPINKTATNSQEFRSQFAKLLSRTQKRMGPATHVGLNRALLDFSNFKDYKEKLSPLLYRLAEELPRRASITENYYLFSKAAKVIMDSRDNSKQLEPTFEKIEQWLDKWEHWARSASQNNSEALGTKPEDLAKLLRFTAFWVDKRVERWKWGGK